MLLLLLYQIVPWKNTYVNLAHRTVEKQMTVALLILSLLPDVLFDTVKLRIYLKDFAKILNQVFCFFFSIMFILWP